MATPWKQQKWGAATALNHHTLNSSTQNLPTHAQQYPNNHAFWYGWRVNRTHQFDLDSVFTYRDACYSYRIAHTSRTRLIFCYFFWCWPARLACWPLQPGNMHYTIVDDDVEVVPIYRCDGKDSQPTRPHENHGLAIEHLPTWTESHCKQQLKSLVVPVQGSLEKPSKIQGTQKCR